MQNQIGLLFMNCINSKWRDWVRAKRPSSAMSLTADKTGSSAKSLVSTSPREQQAQESSRQSQCYQSKAAKQGFCSAAKFTIFWDSATK